QRSRCSPVSCTEPGAQPASGAAMIASDARRDPVPGAILRPDGVDFCVHATHARRVDVVIDDTRVALERVDDVTFAAFVPDVGAGTRYRYSLDGGDPLPDPWSRWQPDGPHGASCVVDPSFEWTDAGWNGVAPGRQFLYEMHVGTFTRERTWRAATSRLEHLVELGITAVELMPIVEFAGEFGWGYDGVHLFAPYHLYGTPSDVRAFVNRAHELGLAVILDVVYNHLGPDGNYMLHYVPEFLSTRHRTDWGACPDFDGPGARIARPFVLQNVAYWIREFRFDGLRIVASQDVKDTSRPHILAEIVRDALYAEATHRLMITRVIEPHTDHLRERAAEREPAPPVRGWRLRNGRALERRLPPQCACRRHRSCRGVLHGLHGERAGAGVARDARLAVSGSAVRLAGPASRE